MEKWEYKTIKIDSKGSKNGIPDTGDFNMTLNQLGSIGWELIFCFPVNCGQTSISETIAVFKRRTNPVSADSRFASPRTPGKKSRSPKEDSRSYGKSLGYKGKSFESDRDSTGYKGKSFGKAGKSPGAYGEKPKSYGEPRTYGKSSGYKGKSKGRAGKGSDD